MMADKAVVKTEKIEVPALEFAKEQQKYFGGEEGTFEFPRAHVASGGMKKFVVPDEYGDEQMESELEGVIVYAHSANAYWSEDSAQGDSPDCFSMDGVTGFDVRTGETRACVKCPNYQYGSARDEHGNRLKGKACKTGYRIYLLRDDDVMPLVVSIPPTSRTLIVRRMKQMFQFANRPLWGLKVVLGLQETKNKRGDKYNLVTLSPKRADGEVVTFDKETMEKLEKYAAVIEEVVRAKQDTSAYEEPPREVYDSVEYETIED